MPRPTDNVYPTNRHICLVCGAAFGFEAGDYDHKAYRDFLGEHALCADLGMPAAGCVAADCSSTAIGPAQRCPSHGGAKVKITREIEF